MKTTTPARDAVTRALEALRPVALADALLDDVEVDIYQGQDGSWYAHVLVDGAVDRDTLPQQGNQPLVDQRSGRHWYDLTCGTTVWAEPKDSPNRTRTVQEARASLDVEVAHLLLDITQRRLRSTLVEIVESLPHREHPRPWKS